MASDSPKELAQKLVQDAIVLERQLKEKIRELATVVETGKHVGNVAIDQDILGIEVSTRETQLETAWKDLSEPELREELRQLHEENLRIKEKAKESVQKCCLQVQKDLQNVSQKLVMYEFQLAATEEDQKNDDDEVVSEACDTVQQEIMLKAEISNLQERLDRAQYEKKALVHQKEHLDQSLQKAKSNDKERAKNAKMLLKKIMELELSLGQHENAMSVLHDKLNEECKRTNMSKSSGDSLKKLLQETENKKKALLEKNNTILHDFTIVKEKLSKLQAQDTGRARNEILLLNKIMELELSLGQQEIGSSLLEEKLAEESQQTDRFKTSSDSYEKRFLIADKERYELVEQCKEWQSRFQSMKLACEEAESRRLQDSKEFESELFTVNELCASLNCKMEKDKEQKKLRKQEKLQRAVELSNARALNESQYRKRCIRVMCVALLLFSLLLAVSVRVIIT